jgi:hypothetical protein
MASIACAGVILYILLMARVLVVGGLLLAGKGRNQPVDCRNHTLNIDRAANEDISPTWSLIPTSPLTGAFLLSVCIINSIVFDVRKKLSPTLTFPAALLALLFAGAAFARTSQKKHKMVLKVKWGRERSVCSVFLFSTSYGCPANHAHGRLSRIEVPFPSSDTTLGQLKLQLSEYTAVPLDQFKLVYGGAVMKDNNAPRSFNLRDIFGASIELLTSLRLQSQTKRNGPANR